MYKSEITSEWISHYEQVHGAKPSEELVRKIDVIFHACDRYMGIGTADRSAGKPAMTKGAILARIRPVAKLYNEENMKRAREAAELLHEFYMLGYEEQLNR